MANVSRIALLVCVACCLSGCSSKDGRSANLDVRATASPTSPPPADSSKADHSWQSVGGEGSFELTVGRDGEFVLVVETRRGKFRYTGTSKSLRDASEQPEHALLELATFEILSGPPHEPGMVQSMAGNVMKLDLAWRSFSSFQLIGLEIDNLSGKPQPDELDCQKWIIQYAPIMPS